MKTSELTGVALDWAVAKCEALVVVYHDDGITQCIMKSDGCNGYKGRYKPSTDWAQGGPIISQHIIQLNDLGDYEWEAVAVGGATARGDTVLEAVCRAYVLQQLGDEVDIPEELTA